MNASSVYEFTCSLHIMQVMYNCIASVHHITYAEVTTGILIHLSQTHTSIMLSISLMTSSAVNMGSSARLDMISECISKACSNSSSSSDRSKSCWNNINMYNNNCQSIPACLNPEIKNSATRLLKYAMRNIYTPQLSGQQSHMTRRKHILFRNKSIINQFYNPNAKMHLTFSKYYMKPNAHFIFFIFIFILYT